MLKFLYIQFEMRGSQRHQIIAIIIATACVIGFAVVNLSTIPAGDENEEDIPTEFEGEYLTEFGGYYYVSDIQDNHGNLSYSVIFHEVNFTFLYRYWPMCEVIDNVTVCISPQPVSVYVQITFPDNSSEILTLVVDFPGSCLIGISSTLHGVSSTHSNPQVGIATAETEELHCCWVYIVSSE